MITTVCEPSLMFGSYAETIFLQTRACLEFIDITDQVVEMVKRSKIVNGFINIQTKHTTTAILINEHEPLLLEDMKQHLERLVPQGMEYAHNNFQIRTINLTPDEQQNGHSHCKAMLLTASTTLNIVETKLQLGQWQRIFFIELDRSRLREISIMLIGLTENP